MEAEFYKENQCLPHTLYFTILKFEIIMALFEIFTQNLWKFFLKMALLNILSELLIFSTIFILQLNILTIKIFLNILNLM